MLNRRDVLIGAGGAVLASTGAGAQTFPSRPITIVVPYPAGGPVDIVARLIAQEASGNLGQPITVDNRGGAAGTIGTQLVARAEPDGHTLVLGTNQTHATNQSLLKSIAYDGVKDFAPVIGIADIQHVLVVRKDLAATSVEELVKLAKDKPGTLNYGSTGVGSASHLCAELFRTKADIAVQHVPFRGSAPMLQELLGDRLDFAFATLPSVISQIDSGALVALAVASAKRAARLQAIPTLAEAGVDDVEADAWFTLFAPAKTPPAAIERLYAAISAALKRDEPKAALVGQGMTLTLRSPSEVAASLPAEVERWAAVVKAANIKVEP